MQISYWHITKGVKHFHNMSCLVTSEDELCRVNTNRGVITQLLSRGLEARSPHVYLFCHNEVVIDQELLKRGQKIHISSLFEGGKNVSFIFKHYLTISAIN